MRDDGVSEVVGVMILITATIILAVIIAFNAGYAGSGISDPINADIMYVGDNGSSYIFEMVEGDDFSLSDIKAVYRSTGDNNIYEAVPDAVPDNHITVGERFTVQKPKFAVKSGDRITYEFIDTVSNTPISSGDISP